MKKLLFIAVVALVAACGFVGCGEYQITLVNPLYPYFFNARSIDLGYRLEYYVKKDLSDSLSNAKRDSNGVYFTPWVPYGYPYPY